MYIRRLITGTFGKTLISILLGLGLATLFRKVCNDRNCLVFKAPEIKKIENQVFEFDDKCYKFNKKATKCDNNKKIVDFA
jgi:hypothetical protein|tara:strand:- start:1752 stop:1991 length:240 start_codon:yes stop_codon:yes gene_type:complete